MQLASFYLTIGIPLLYLANLWAVTVVGNDEFPLLFRLMGVGMAVAGLGLWLVSYIHLGRSFGVLPQKQKRVKRGLYKWLKHPMYTGILLTFGGLAIANNSLAGLGFTGLIMVPLLYIRARYEEKLLD